MIRKQSRLAMARVRPALGAVAMMAGRSHPSLNSLESISDEAAATWAGPFANIRLFGLKTLTPAAGASLTKGGRPPHSPTPVPVLTVSGAAGAKAIS